MSTHLDLRNKMQRLATELSEHVTHIYGRDDLLLASLLTYYSPLEFTWCGQAVRGWLDILLFGDTHCGKSETVFKLRDFFGRGNVSRGKATFAGLVGGIDRDRANGAFAAKPGLFVMAHQGLVIIDEMQAIDPDDVEKMTDMRSSGVCQVTAITSFERFGKCRKIWISNPRPAEEGGSAALSNSLSPVEELHRVFKAEEDLARFDLILGARTREVDYSQRGKTAEGLQRYTQEMCQRRLLEAWQMKPEIIEFSAPAVRLCQELSTKLVQDWQSPAPLIVPANQDIRLARLAASVANLMRIPARHHEHGILVATEHVQWAYDWLISLFEHNDLRYADYVRSVRHRQQKDDNKIQAALDALRKHDKYQTILWWYARYDEAAPKDLIEMFQVLTAQSMLSILLNVGLVLRQKTGAYKKTSMFTKLLNTTLAAEVIDPPFPEPVNGRM